nr:PilN domain-containing protein [Pelomonas sp. P8]
MLLTRPGHATGPDFIKRPSRVRTLVWAWTATAAAACGLVAWQVQGQQQEAQRLAEQAAVLDRLARPAAARPAAANTAATTAARARTGAAARQLDTDWAALWTDVERALPPSLQLTALDLERQSLRLEGQAGDTEAVTRLVDRLAMQAGAGEEVVLTRLQKQDTPADAGGSLRFELVRRAGAAR